MTAHTALLLATAYRHVISEPTIEAAQQRFGALASVTISMEDFAAAVAASLREGFIREPVRLPEGALQCHWHLELTPKGVEAAKQSCSVPII
jgi:hypothetical protein